MGLFFSKCWKAPAGSMHTPGGSGGENDQAHMHAFAEHVQQRIPPPVFCAVRIVDHARRNASEPEDKDGTTMKNTETTTCYYIGVDIAKDEPCVDLTNTTCNVKNTPKDVRACLAKILRGKASDGKTPHVCYESTGAYGNVLRDACASLCIDASVLNPRNVRLFATSVGINAKSDPIDARLITRFAQASTPAPTPPPTPVSKVLRGLFALRDAMSKQMTHVASLCDALDGEPLALARRELTRLRKRIDALEARIAVLRDEDPRLARVTAELEAIPGVGLLTAVRVAVLVPELGTLGRRGAACLAGLAPFTRESGKWAGRRFIGGGRGDIRCALYMGALSVATRSRGASVLGDFYRRLRDRGKPHNVALTAVMRRLFEHMDRVISRLPAEELTGALSGAR